MENRLTSIILESISDGVFTVDTEWRITSFNSAAEKITGIRRGDAIGSLCSEIFKSNMCESECPLRKTMKGGKPIINRQGFIVTGSGRRIPISVSTALLIDEDGKVIGGAETFRDLTEIETLKNGLKAASGHEHTSASPAMIKLLDMLPVIADSPSTILIQGDTGTGKEVTARRIHDLSPRKKASFVPINCGALPENLLESELFGYRKGAFTGADRDKPGRFAIAAGGTLFLDEIGEMPQSLQVKLLRVLQEKEYEPLGATRAEKSQCRIICATNRNLKQMVDEGSFRQDLYYRINIITLELPPLRDRREDIPALAERFLVKFRASMNRHINGFSSAVYEAFNSYSWPGNIRELENAVERAVLLCTGRTIEMEHLPPEIQNSAADTKPAPEISLKEARLEAERLIIEKALSENGFSADAAARALGIDRSTIYRRISSLGIHIPPRNTD